MKNKKDKAPVIKEPIKCMICLEEVEQSFHMGCNHYACMDCYQSYFKHKVADNRSLLTVKCID